MLAVNNRNYYLFEELKPMVINVLLENLRQTKEGSKFIGNIDKVRFSNYVIGKWLIKNGYLKKRIYKEGLRKYYYFKIEESI